MYLISFIIMELCNIIGVKKKRDCSEVCEAFKMTSYPETLEKNNDTNTDT